MSLNGPQLKQLQDALLDAYTAGGLRQMLRVQMDVDLPRVAGGDNLTEITFSLIQWAERTGQIMRLIEAAYAGNQENQALTALAAAAQSWFGSPDQLSRPLDDMAPAMPRSTGQIFLNYSRQDSQQMHVVYRALIDAGLSVWTDEGLAVGTQDWENAIEQAIDGACCMVVLMSPAAKQSKWVRTEVSYALDGGLDVFPLLLRGNKRQSIPLILYSIQYEDGRPDLPAACDRLITAMARGGVHPIGSSPPGTRQATRRTPSIEFEWITIPAGDFLMGSDKELDPLAFDDEMPQHRLYLPAYRIARYPVTNAHYKHFVDATGHGSPQHLPHGHIPQGKEQHPVVHVTWHDVVAFCKWAGVMLPSEAQWEKAVRGTDGRNYPWGNERPTEQLCNFDGNEGDSTPVGNYSPRGDSPYGVADGAGNVWEWTRSLYKAYPYAASDGREDPPARDLLTLRGGSWFHYESYVRCAERLSYNPNFSDDDLGFRVVAPAEL